MPAQALAVVATLVSFAQHGNRVDLNLDRGSAEIVWVSPTSFHFRRSIEGPLAPASKPERSSDAVALQLEDSPSALHVRSKQLDVIVQKHGALLKVLGPDGATLMADVSEPQSDGKQVSWDREAPAGVRYFGLGQNDDRGLDLRGKKLETFVPFLFSSAGYGEDHRSARIDFTATDRYRILSTDIDYTFYYGPKPKEIFQQRNPEETLGGVAGIKRPASWDGLRSRILETVHQAMSGPYLYSINLDNIDSSPDELKSRIRQVAALVPNIPASLSGLSSFRLQLASFYEIYSIETRDKHLPIWHPLPMEFPDDPECAHHADEFMLGDEMLIAPIYEAGNKRQVYLPSGTWTSLETNQKYEGRRTISVETAALPVFAHNGSIVPLDSPAGMGLHYFPNEGGEFFLLEKDTGQYTQIHAAPAADVMRLEIESKVDRDYQWVVHNVERPSGVGFGDVRFALATTAKLGDRTWLYDAAHKNLMVRINAKANEDNIVNVSW